MFDAYMLAHIKDSISKRIETDKSLLDRLGRKSEYSMVRVQQLPFRF